MIIKCLLYKQNNEIDINLKNRYLKSVDFDDHAACCAESIELSTRGPRISYNLVVNHMIHYLVRG